VYKITALLPSKTTRRYMSSAIYLSIQELAIEKYYEIMEYQRKKTLVILDAISWIEKFEERRAALGFLDMKDEAKLKENRARKAFLERLVAKTVLMLADLELLIWTSKASHEFVEEIVCEDRLAVSKRQSQVKYVYMF
jgi:hypothetical protein